MIKKLIILIVILFFVFSFAGLVSAQESMNVKMSYNGPADVENNAVHEYAVNFKDFVEMGTNGRIQITLYSDSQLGNEEQRMEQTMGGSAKINVASNAGMVSVY